MERNSTAGGSKLMRLITIPIRALGKARDLYVRSMNSYADRGCYGGSGFGYSVADPLPRSFSASSARSSSAASDDLRDLIRAASSRAYSDKLDLGALDQPHRTPTNDAPRPPRYPHAKGVPRSASVGMTKIDEDKAIEFEADEGIDGRNGRKKDRKKGSLLFPRSHSYASSDKRF